MNNQTPEPKAEPSGHANAISYRGKTAWATRIWLLLLSGTISLAVTVALFDRTTLSGISRLWLSATAICFAVTWMWWARPSIHDGRLTLCPYEPRTLLSLTFPILGAFSAFVVLVYGSEEFHNYIRNLLFYDRLLSDSNWPIGLFTALFLVSIAVAVLRHFLAGVGRGASLGDAVVSAITNVGAIIPIGIAGCALLLSTTVLMMINVNFWRYWATADGWATIGHYPYTMTDILHVIEGGVAPYFVSFPLLPAALTASYRIAGHDTLGSFLPIIVANTLLPVGVFLTLRQITGNQLLSFLVSLFVGTFPLLRNYTMDVGEADSLLMAALAFAAYFRVRANRPDAGATAEVLAGLAAALATFARAEGILYVVPMYLATMIVRWQSRRYWLSALVLGMVVGAFAAVCLREFGMLWPGNHSATISLNNFARTLEVASKGGVFSMYAEALGISNTVLAVVMAGVLVATALSTLHMLRKDFQLSYMPAMAIANVVMVFFVGPVPAEAAKFHDFFRHMSYGFPLLAITLGYGLSAALNYLGVGRGAILRLVAYVGLVTVVLMELSVLEKPVTPGLDARGPLMTSDVHVSAVQLIVDRYPLPVMRFRLDGTSYVPDMPEYMSTYPDDVYEHYRDKDVRRSGNAASYYEAARAVFLFLLLLSTAAAMLGSAPQLVRPSPRDAERHHETALSS